MNYFVLLHLPSGRGLESTTWMESIEQRGTPKPRGRIQVVASLKQTCDDAVFINVNFFGSGDFG